MRYVAAYLLAALSGNNNPSADDLKKIIGSVGIDCEADKITKIIGELKGKNIEELITKGPYLLIWRFFSFFFSYFEKKYMYKKLVMGKSL